MALMVDRSWSMYEVEVVANAEHFEKGTILEGELVWQELESKRLLYLIFDCVLLQGRSLIECAFEERIAAAISLTQLSHDMMSSADLHDHVMETNSIVLIHFDPPILMRPKQFVNRCYCESLWSARDTTDHRVDGIILQRTDTAYMHGTAMDTILKWKEHSTIDLKGCTSNLQTLNGALPSEFFKRAVQVHSSSIVPTAKDIIEYLITVTDQLIVLFPLRSRQDKTAPNSIKTVIATIQDVIDNISVQELMANTSAVSFTSQP